MSRTSGAAADYLLDEQDQRRSSGLPTRPAAQQRDDREVGEQIPDRRHQAAHIIYKQLVVVRAGALSGTYRDYTRLHYLSRRSSWLCEQAPSQAPTATTLP
jgi:hypothetical protein